MRKQILVTCSKVMLHGLETSLSLDHQSGAVLVASTPNNVLQQHSLYNFLVLWLKFPFSGILLLYVVSGNKSSFHP